MTGIDRTNLTRRNLLKAGSALAAVPLIGFAAPATLAQGQTKSPTKVLDFMTNADVAKAEQEGQLVFYCHENEAGTAGIMQGFNKDFPKIKTSYVRAQTGALYNKILSERSAGRFDVDVIQLSDLAPAVDFQKKGGYEHYVSPESHAYKADNLSTPVGSFFWTGVDPAGIAYNTDKVSGADVPKNWQDILNPKFKGHISVKISASGLQFVQWYCLRELYGDKFWKEFANQKRTLSTAACNCSIAWPRATTPSRRSANTRPISCSRAKAPRSNSSRRRMAWWQHR